MGEWNLGYNLKNLGGWSGLLKIAVVTGVIGLFVAYIVVDQVANVLPWADTITGRSLLMGAGWALLALWALNDRDRR